MNPMDLIAPAAALDRSQISALAYAAKDGGHRIVADGKIIYAGIGNMSGVYGESYWAAFDSKWKKSGPGLIKKLNASYFNLIEVKQFCNTTRDRGRWITVWEER